MRFWYKIVKIKRIVEFVIPRAVSVLFFKMKVAGMTRPWLQSTATTTEVKKERTGLSQNTRNVFIMSIFDDLFCTSVSGPLG